MRDDLSDVVIPNRPCPPARHSLAEWYEEAATLDHLRFIGRPPIDRDWWLGARESERRAKVIELHRKGHTFEAIADMVKAPAADVARPFSKERSDVDGVPRALLIERAWTEDPDASAKAIARRLRCHHVDVTDLAEVLGHEMRSVARARDGGDSRYGTAELAQMQAMRDAGHSWAQIGKAFGVDRSTVYTVFKRRQGAAATA